MANQVMQRKKDLQNVCTRWLQKVWRTIVTVGKSMVTTCFDLENKFFQWLRGGEDDETGGYCYDYDFLTNYNNNYFSSDMLDFVRVESHLNEECINRRWQMGKLIGKGGFGQVYRARDIATGEKVAVKTEPKGKWSHLEKEYKIYSLLNKKSASGGQSAVGFPRARYFESTKERDVLVMDCLGNSLEELVQHMPRCPKKTLLAVGAQALRRLQALHETGYVHGDVKPANFMLSEDEYKLYLIDFGLARQYLERDGRHVRYGTRGTFVGTQSFASINAHEGVESSRRDDLESLGYTLVYMNLGYLPWELKKWPKLNGLYGGLGKFKKWYPLEELCANMPVQLLVFLRYVRGLEFAERPKYEAFVKLFEEGFRSERLELVKADKQQGDNRKREPVVHIMTR